MAALEGRVAELGAQRGLVHEHVRVMCQRGERARVRAPAVPRDDDLAAAAQRDAALEERSLVAAQQVAVRQRHDA